MGANAPKQALSWEDARQRVVSEVKAGRQKPQTESVRLEEAFGRVTAEDIRADRDYPALARALRDGFAVRSSDVPGTLPLAGESRAGAPLPPPLLPGQTLEIMTGAPIPEGADAVVMVEHVTRNGNSVTLPAAAAGQFINPQGAEARRNDVLVPAEIRLDASHISVLAMVGKTYVVVYRRPVVAILSTGDELVAVDATPAPFEIRNSNSYSLASLVADAGGIPQVLPPAPDTEEGLLALLRKGLAADLLLISGGVSAGKYDLVKPCLAQLGTEFFFERVRIQPGQPTAFGKAGDRFVFGLPGNPGSSMVTFQVFARAALELLSGQMDSVLPVAYAKFAAPFQHKRGLTRFLPAHLGPDGLLTHIPWQGSSDIPALARANVFLIANDDREQWQEGEFIRILTKP